MKRFRFLHQLRMKLTNRHNFSIQSPNGEVLKLRFLETDPLLAVQMAHGHGIFTVPVLTLAPIGGAPGESSQWILIPLSQIPDSNAQLELNDCHPENWGVVTEVEDIVGHDVNLPSSNHPRHKNGDSSE